MRISWTLLVCSVLASCVWACSATNQRTCASAYDQLLAKYDLAHQGEGCGDIGAVSVVELSPTDKLPSGAVAQDLERAGDEAPLQVTKRESYRFCIDDPTEHVSELVVINTKSERILEVTAAERCHSATLDPGEYRIQFMRNVAPSAAARAQLRLEELPEEPIEAAVAIDESAQTYLFVRHMEGAPVQKAEGEIARHDSEKLILVSSKDCQFCDLSDLYLFNADFSGGDFRGADLSYSFLSNANLRQADLSGTIFEGAHLENADLGAANLRSAVFDSAFTQGAELEQAPTPRCPNAKCNQEVEGNLYEHSGSY